MHRVNIIDFTLSPSQQALRSNAANFAQAYLKDAPATYNQHETQRARFESTADIYRAAVQAGLIKGQIPTSLGGDAEGLVDAAILVEEPFAVEPSAALTILGTGIGLTPLLVAGNDELRARFLQLFFNPKEDEYGAVGPIASFVHSEPEGSANWLEKGGKGLQTTARREGDGWVTNGEKVRDHEKCTLCLDKTTAANYSSFSCGRPTPPDGTPKELTYSVSSVGSQSPAARQHQMKIHLRIY